jgi:hypothetical protein
VYAGSIPTPASNMFNYLCERLACGKAFATVRHELNIISQVYEAARYSWRMRDLDNPMRRVKRPPAWAKPRNVRLKGSVNLRTFLAEVRTAREW